MNELSGCQPGEDEFDLGWNTSVREDQQMAAEAKNHRSDLIAGHKKVRKLYERRIAEGRMDRETAEAKFADWDILLEQWKNA